jgi:MFS family permease
MPARDSLLSRVALRSPGGDIQQTVTIVTGIQFGAQLIGILIGREAPQLSDQWGRLMGSPSPAIGAGFVLLAIVLSLGAAAFCTSNVRPAPPSVRAARPSEPAWRRNLRDILEGLREVRQSERMMPVVTLMFFGGLFLMGVFSVHLQVLVRDVYGRNIGDYSAIMMAFMIGVTTTTTILSRVSKSIVRQGRMMMLSFLGGAVVMGVVYTEPALWTLYLLLFFWGCTAGVSMSMSRAIVQEAARESHRARIMSVFQLGFLGGAPIGSLVMGLFTTAVGPIKAALLPMIGIIVVWIGLFFLTDLWHLSRQPKSNSSELPNLSS